MELAIALWIFCGIGAAFVAQSRGADGCLWFGLGVLLGPFGLAFAFASGTDRKCPHCRERIHPDATRCPKCQADLSDLSSFAPETPELSRKDRVAAFADWIDPNPALANEPVRIPTTRKCPDCAEIVRAEARKCRFCGFVFPEVHAENPAQVEPVAAVNAEDVRVAMRTKAVKFGQIVAVILVAAFIVGLMIAFWPSR